MSDSTPLTGLSFKSLLAPLSTRQAAAAAARLKATLERAGRAAHAGDLSLAARLLADERLLDGTGFSFAPPDARPLIDPRLVATDERSFYAALVKSLRPGPSVSTAGRVTLPVRPSLTAANDRELWVLRAFVRIVGEELGHVVQKLSQRADPERWYLSRMFSGERAEAIKFVAKSSEIVNQQLLRAGVGIHYFDEEMDVYAFLIEAFGADLMPWWIGKDSPYFLRFYVDQTLEAQGFAGRAWRPE